MRSDGMAGRNGEIDRIIQRRKWWTLAAVVAGMFMLMLDLMIVNVALPSIGRDFHASLADLQWVIDAYIVALGAGLPIGGSLADLWGRRKLFVMGIVVFTACSLLCGLSSGPFFLILARAGQGVGGAVVWAAALGMLSDAFRGRDRGMAFGLYGALLSIAAAVGPLLGGAITGGLGWRWIFWVNIPIGIAVIIVTLAKLRESRDPEVPRPDWIGFTVFAAALVLLIYGLINAAGGWEQLKVDATLAAGAVLLAAFPFVEATRRHPMLDLAIMRKPAFIGGLIAAAGVNASFWTLFTYLGIYLQQQMGYSPEQAGARFLVLTGTIFAVSAIAGRLTRLIQARVMISAGFLLVSAGMLLMGGLTVSSSWLHLLTGMIVSGAGAGLVSVPMGKVAVDVVHVSKAGMASGINGTARQVGLSAGVAVLGVLLAIRMRQSVAAHLAHTPLAGQAARIASGVSASAPSSGIRSGLGPAASQLVSMADHAGFIGGLNEILVVGSVVAFVSGVLSLLLIRNRDFVSSEMSLSQPASGTTCSRPPP